MEEIELMSSPQRNLTPPSRTLNGLPTLWEVLSRRTLPPLDLFSFYIYMRDQQRSVDYLDFWLDVAQHISLCRHYVRELRSAVLEEEPEAGSSTNARARTTSNPVSEGLTTVTRADLRASAEKILYTYLLPGAAREIVLPQSVTREVIHGIEEEHRHDPEVFDVAKDYVFQAMERDALPGFLRAKAMGNLTPLNIALRVVAGFIGLFGGLWTAFALVFLNYSKQTRCWIILPFLFANYCLVSYSYAVDPILGGLGFSEYTFMSFARIRDPFVRRLTITRSAVSFGIVVFFTSILSLIFILVPGPGPKRRIQE